MDETFLRYRDPAFRYAKSRNPARVRCRDDALRDGLNCVALAHLMIRDLFSYTLPAHLQALELVRDLEHFEPVPDPEHMQAGDLVWLGEHRPRADLRDPAAATRVPAHRQAPGPGTDAVTAGLVRPGKYAGQAEPPAGVDIGTALIGRWPRAVFEKAMVFQVTSRQRIVLPPDEYVATLARKRMAAGALFRDAQGRVLLVDPTYKSTMDLPGGAVEADESPHAACRREVAEELGLDRAPGRVLAVDWVPSVTRH